jgi:hypothetical protein
MLMVDRQSAEPKYYMTCGTAAKPRITDRVLHTTVRREEVPHYQEDRNVALLCKRLYIDVPAAEERVGHQLQRSDVHIYTPSMNEFRKVRVQIRVLRC